MIIYENIKQLESVGQLHSNTLVNADCLEAMKYIADKSIDMVLCDLPYGQYGTKDYNRKVNYITRDNKELK